VDLISHNYVVKAPPSNIGLKVGSKPGSTRSVLSIQRKREDDKVWETVEYNRTFTPLILANSSPLHPSIIERRRRKKNVSPVLPCLRALWDFQKQLGRLPDTHNNTDDLKAFTILAMEKVKELTLDNSFLNSEFLRKFLQNLGTEMAPVSAMVGGLLAQDAINAIQHSEAPINNLCLFDGDSYNVSVYSLRPESFNQQPTNGISLPINGSKPITTREKTPEGAIVL
jgi:ubiquitin-like 1-activating enzyme E1 A